MDNRDYPEIDKDLQKRVQDAFNSIEPTGAVSERVFASLVAYQTKLAEEEAAKIAAREAEERARAEAEAAARAEAEAAERARIEAEAAKAAAVVRVEADEVGEVESLESYGITAVSKPAASSGAASGIISDLVKAVDEQADADRAEELAARDTPAVQPILEKDGLFDDSVGGKTALGTAVAVGVANAGKDIAAASYEDTMRISGAGERNVVSTDDRPVDDVAPADDALVDDVPTDNAAPVAEAASTDDASLVDVNSDNDATPADDQDATSVEESSWEGLEPIAPPEVELPAPRKITPLKVVLPAAAVVAALGIGWFALGPILSGDSIGTPAQIAESDAAQRTAATAESASEDAAYSTADADADAASSNTMVAGSGSATGSGSAAGTSDSSSSNESSSSSSDSSSSSSSVTVGQGFTSYSAGSASSSSSSSSAAASTGTTTASVGTTGSAGTGSTGSTGSTGNTTAGTGGSTSYSAGTGGSTSYSAGTGGSTSYSAGTGTSTATVGGSYDSYTAAPIAQDSVVYDNGGGGGGGEVVTETITTTTTTDSRPQVTEEVVVTDTSKSTWSSDYPSITLSDGTALSIASTNPLWELASISDFQDSATAYSADGSKSTGVTVYQSFDNPDEYYVAYTGDTGFFVARP